jgi:hypothetical protein
MKYEIENSDFIENFQTPGINNTILSTSILLSSSSLESAEMAQLNIPQGDLSKLQHELQDSSFFLAYSSSTNRKSESSINPADDQTPNPIDKRTLNPIETQNNLKRKLCLSSAVNSSSELDSDSDSEAEMIENPQTPKKKLKINRLNDLLNCGICNKLYEDPVTLPCGDTVCKKDIDTLISMNDESSESMCILCHKTFTSCISNIPVNKNIQEQINLRLNDELDFGENFARSSKSVNNLSQAIMKINHLTKTSNSIIKVRKHFKNLKEETISERDLKKQQID